MERVRWRWWASFGLFAALGLGWVIATPLFAAPDEPAHVVRASSAGYGELLGHAPRVPVPPPIGDAATAVKAPGLYEDGGGVSCLTWQKDKTADCLDLRGTRHRVEVNTYVGHHLPAYYVAVGFLSRWIRPGAGQVFVMRALGMLLIAALLASALESLRRLAAPMWAAAGFALAVTPMVLFIAATVSPSGMEIGAAIGVWVNGAVLALEAKDRVDSRVVDRLGIATCLLVLSRALSPLWLAVIGVTLLVLTTGAALRAIALARRVWVWAGALVVSFALDAWWFVYAHPLDYFVGEPVHGATPTLLRTSFGKSGEVLHEMVGVFGWLDTRVPEATFLIWIVGLGALAALMLALGSNRFAWALLVATAATAIVPPIVEAAGASEAGFIWQGRYSLPLAVGVPIIAGIGVGASESAKRLGRRLAIVLVAVLGVGQVLAFAEGLRRYAVGADGPIWFFGAARWDPPIPNAVLLVAYAVVVAVALWWIVLAAPTTWRPGRDRAPAVEPDETAPPPAVTGEAAVTV